MDPNKGKAYDDQGRAFEGQHMKSAAEYPEHQGNPDNIQFLTKEEHLAAHKGSWQNPTNWFYDPVTREFAEFGENEVIPCKIIQLSNPVIIIQTSDIEPKTQEKPPEVERNKGEPKNVDAHITKEVNTVPKQVVTLKSQKTDSTIVKGLKGIGKFVVSHPVESLEIARTVLVGAVKIASKISGRNNKGKPTSYLSTSPVKKDVSTKVADIIDKANRAMPSENDVTGHRQRYHTKNGIEWRNKASYHRRSKEKS